MIATIVILAYSLLEHFKHSTASKYNISYLYTAQITEILVQATKTPIFINMSSIRGFPT